MSTANSDQKSTQLQGLLDVASAVANSGRGKTKGTSTSTSVATQQLLIIAIHQAMHKHKALIGALKPPGRSGSLRQQEAHECIAATLSLPAASGTVPDQVPTLTEICWL